MSLQADFAAPDGSLSPGTVADLMVRPVGGGR